MEADSIQRKHVAKGPSAQDFAKVVLLLGLAYYFADVVFSDNLKNYTNQQPEWLALLTAGLFALLGVASGVGLLRRSRASVQHEHEHTHHEHDKDETTHVHEGHEHNHAPISWAVLLVVALPLVLGKAVPSKPLGASAITTNNLATISLAVEGGGQTTLDPPDWNLMEWKLAFQHLVHPQDWFNGQDANVIGFVVRPPDAPAGHFVAARFVMYHCAADARGVGMLVKWSGSDRLAQDSWVRIKGIMRVQEFNGEPVLVLDALQVDDKIGEPETPYLRPFLRNNSDSGG